MPFAESNTVQEKVSYHKLFLPAGLLLLVVGSWGIANYFRLHGPSDQELHELALRDVSKLTEEPEIPGSKRVDTIWLETTNRGGGRPQFSKSLAPGWCFWKPNRERKLPIRHFLVASRSRVCFS